MFGREQSEPPVLERPSFTPEEEAVMIDLVMERVEIIEGEEWLDGYKLPPNDDDIWHPETFSMKIYHTYEHPETGEIYITSETKQVESTITNADIREERIRSLSQGRSPLFQTWDEILSRPFEYERPESSVRRLGKKVLKFFGS